MKRLIARLVLVAVFSATTTPAMASAHHGRTGDVCAVLATVAGTYGPYSINSAGEVLSAGEVVLSCDAATALISASDDRDPLLCAIFVLLLVYLVIKGVIEVDDAGDIYLLGAKYWDCPPYDDPPGVL